MTHKFSIFDHAFKEARETVKRAMRKAGLKLSHFPRKEIDRLARELLMMKEGKPIINRATREYNRWKRKAITKK